MFKTGIAHLPLHSGKAPRWLFERMVKLARALSVILIQEHGVEYFLQRLSDPYWFQSFGCILGFDWHSSGLTTTVCGALKEALRGTEADYGMFVCGGKGGTSRKGPHEIETFATRFSIVVPAHELVYASKISAKVDNTAVQDGFQLYHHSFIFSCQGSWVVIQQGFNQDTRWARRYHWLSEGVRDFVCEPHAAVCCDHHVKTLNMVAQESQRAREASVLLTRQKPQKLLRECRQHMQLELPRRHLVLMQDIDSKHLERILLKTYEAQPHNFESLLAGEGVGPKTIRALALMAELLFDAKASYRDPARFSFAHGGKDGYPYAINRQDYDQSIHILREAIDDAKIGAYDKMRSLKRLARFSQTHH